jgi:hypothetical protein
MPASDIAITNTAPEIQRLYVPATSTSGDQRNFSVHAKPTTLIKPIDVRSTCRTRRYSGTNSLTIPYGRPSEK